jgi:DNA-binding transcriptional LysR family regulator
MELRQIRLFIALAEELHFGRAATRVHTTQSSVSQQLKRLEDLLKVKLVSRTRAHVSLTEAGVVFLERARRIVAEVDGATEVTRRARLGEVGRLRVALSTPALYGDVPRIVRAYRARWPDVDLSVKVMASDDQERALLSREVDVGYSSLAPQSTLLHAQEVGREAFCVALPEGHRLAAQETVGMADLRDEGFIMVRRAAGPALFDEIVAIAREAGFTLKVVEEVVAFPTILGLVMAGVGLAFVPRSLVPAGQRGLVLVDIAGRSPELPMYLTRRADATSPVLQNFLSFVRAGA